MMTARIKQKTVFIRENDSLESVQNLFSDELARNEAREHLNFVFAKQNNNYVGYYLFLHDNRAYKIIVLPKIIEEHLDEREKIRRFINYLGEFFRLGGLSDKVLESPLEIAFENMKNDSSAQKDLDGFLYHKYSYLIKQIEVFFKRHQKKYSRTLSYASQSVRHRLDLRKNVRAIDKSMVHQLRSEQYVYSDMARITYGALRLFMSTKVVLITDEIRRQQLEGVCRGLINMLLRKFHLDRSFSLNVQFLISLSSFRHFRRGSESKKLYRQVLMLFGQERWFDEQESDTHYDLNGEYLFFRPEVLYEKVVEEWLRDKQDVEVEVKPEKNYILSRIQDDGKSETMKSIPDFIAMTNDGLVVVDAKWKVLSTINSIQDADVLKLQRDFLVHRANNAMLVYCKVNKSVWGKWKIILDETPFHFQIEEIPVRIE